MVVHYIIIILIAIIAMMNHLLNHSPSSSLEVHENVASSLKCDYPHGIASSTFRTLSLPSFFLFDSLSLWLHEELEELNQSSSSVSKLGFFCISLPVAGLSCPLWIWCEFKKMLKDHLEERNPLLDSERRVSVTPVNCTTGWRRRRHATISYKNCKWW